MRRGARIAFAPDSLLTRINSLLARINFPVVAELIPCSAAQGIRLRRSRKLLNYQTFSGRIFAGKRSILEKFPVVSLLRPFWVVQGARPVAARAVTTSASEPRRIAIFAAPVIAEPPSRFSRKRRI
jgi:hypothetical protein